MRSGGETGEDEEGFTHTLVELLCFGVETGLCFAQATGVIGDISTTMYLGGVKVEQDGEVGHVSLGGDQGKARDKLDADAAGMSLVGDTGIKAAIGDDQFSRCKRWQYDIGKMLGAVGLKKKGLRQRSNGKVRAVEQEIAYLHAERGAAWFARAHVGCITRCQPLFQ